MKRVIKAILPDIIVRQRRRFLMWRRNLRNAKLTPKQIFTDIYRRNVWGGTPGTYCSGSGSLPEQVEAYSAFVREFIQLNRIESVVDLGCGDFRVAKTFINQRIRYVGIDVVDDLIDANRKNFASGMISFQCLDIVEDDLPAADLCLIRQVLQHLSNAQILSVLGKLEKYRYVLVTEHYPAASAMLKPNLDKVTGPDIRVDRHSGVFLDLPPFNVNNLQLVLDAPVLQPIAQQGERLRTFLIGNASPAVGVGTA